jgi:hypothetical protein
MNTLIQLEGFIVTTTSRTYNFLVIDPSGGSRHFAVRVPLESFRPTRLKFQDGPLITRERLLQELDRETQELRAEALLNVGEPDILIYMERHYPPKARTWQRAVPRPQNKG